MSTLERTKTNVKAIKQVNKKIGIHDSSYCKILSTNSGALNDLQVITNGFQIGFLDACDKIEDFMICDTYPATQKIYNDFLNLKYNGVKFRFTAQEIKSITSLSQADQVVLILESGDKKALYKMNDFDYLINLYNLTKNINYIDIYVNFDGLTPKVLIEKENNKTVCCGLGVPFNDNEEVLHKAGLTVTFAEV